MAGTEPPNNRPPSVNALALTLRHTGLPHPILVDIARQAIASGDLANVETSAWQAHNRLLQPVTNATGVLLHTNLGRAPLATHIPASFHNLELDLLSGERGSRNASVAYLLELLTGAEAALVVNNGAAAVVLALSALARGQGVAVSRGELVQLGGNFRLPDVLAESGAVLVEVGTTNHTTISDYRNAIENETLPAHFVLKVHQSNFRIVGFTEDVSIAALAKLDVPLIADIGSGLLDTEMPWLANKPKGWLANEPAIKQTLRQGADLVIFSGDKLFGGPQAGIVVGDAELIQKLKAHSLYRAFRPGSMVLQSLQEVVLAYLHGDVLKLPFWQMVDQSVSGLQARIERVISNSSLRDQVKSVPLQSVLGGGSTPGEELPSWGIEIEGDHQRRLRAPVSQAVIARVHQGNTYLDFRTVLPQEDRLVGQAIVAALGLK